MNEYTNFPSDFVTRTKENLRPGSEGSEHDKIILVMLFQSVIDSINEKQ